jgi:hypothetical protein
MKIEQGAEQGLRRLVVPLRRLGLVPRGRATRAAPYAFKIVDEQGNERDVVARRRRFTRWPW